MTESPTSLLGGSPILPEEIAQRQSVATHSCSVTIIGDPKHFEELPNSVTRVLVTIEYPKDHAALSEESMQRTLSEFLVRLAGSSKVVEDIIWCPVVAALERSPEGACYTILCKFQGDNEQQRIYDLISRGFKRLLRKNGMRYDECLWVSAMEADTHEFKHLLIRTSRRSPGPYPVLEF